MTNENQLQNALILEAVQNVQNTVDFGDIKQLTMQMFQNAQASELFGITPQERHDNFYMFKLLYNLLLTFEMQYQPDLTGVNLI